MEEMIAIIDFGSQYSALIARRFRELGVYSELFPHTISAQELTRLPVKGIVLSGGPNSIYATGAPRFDPSIIDLHLPILGICYGMQALAHALGGKVTAAESREYGRARVKVPTDNPLLPRGTLPVWMSHGDQVTEVPPGFTILAGTGNCPVAAMIDFKRKIFGIQFHPEVEQTAEGMEILRRFALEICGFSPGWKPASIISQAVESVKKQVGDKKVLSALSGGVDSAIATVIVRKAVGDNLTAVFVDTGLLRKGEPQAVEAAFRSILGDHLVVVFAADEFYEKLKGVTDPEAKRRIIGSLFIETFQRTATQLGDFPFLVQGTIYPDVIESRSSGSQTSERIKTHHNVGGLPEKMPFQVVEPLRQLFKDEVRLVGEELDLPTELVWRQPFPGPGLAVRCLGEVSRERVEVLREADAIFTSELVRAGLLGKPVNRKMISQAFAVLLPVRSVGVMGDGRTYQEAVALRAVRTSDFMTAEWFPIPSRLLARISSRIVNEVHGVNRVAYDITGKPPATIEWE
jgi:GMP synthase (glutamine-hydrolysing)